MTFPDHDCSNGLSGNSVREIAARHFCIRERHVESKFSTLGGTGDERGDESGRSARQHAHELMLVLEPKCQMQTTTETQRRGYSIRIFLAEGTPSGLKFVEKSNWSGLGVVCPRPRFSAVKDRREFARAGVYVLLGPSASSDVPIAYIGEADPVRSRLEQHHSLKDFWTVAYFFTSKDTNLNKAHIEYLEHRLVALGKEAKRCKLENANAPGKPSLSEADEADVECFLDELLLCFPLLGVTIFEKPEAKQYSVQILWLKNKGIIAQGYESEDGFVVKRGSTAVRAVVESLPGHAIALRCELENSGMFKPKDESFYEPTQDYEFSSPSTAAAALIGANINGRDWWKTSDGTTLKQLQEKVGGMTG